MMDMDSDGLSSIPPKDALILWRQGASGVAEGQGPISSVLVVRGRSSSEPISTQARALPCSAGCCSAWWLSGEHWTESPLGIFSYMAAMGFADHGEKIAALWQFAKITGLRWPVDMLRELGADMTAVDGEAVI